MYILILTVVSKYFNTAYIVKLIVLVAKIDFLSGFCKGFILSIKIIEWDEYDSLNLCKYVHVFNVEGIKLIIIKNHLSN